MAVDTTHELYDQAKDAWRLVRDTAFGGGRKVKKAGRMYLPQLRGQSLLDYDAYVQRANFFNATKRTLAAFVGFIFTNNPEIEVGDSPSKNVSALLRDATLSGKQFYDFVKDTVRDVVSVGRRGTMVEWADPAKDNRPFLVPYDTEDIINWRYRMVNGKRMLSLIVLREKSDEPVPADPFQSDTVTRWRVMQLDEESSQPFCVTSVFEKNAKGVVVKVYDEYPSRGTDPLDFIPFVFHNVTGDEADPAEVPMDDLAQINISHYQNSADLEQGRHLCGSPTLVLIGFPIKGEYFLGATQALVSEEVGASAMMLQIDANGLSALSGGLDEKERQMAALGARMLEQQGTGQTQEAYQTVQLRNSGGVSALTDVAIQCSVTLSKVLRMAVWWDDRSVAMPEDLGDEEGDNVHVELNTDFTTSTLDAPMLTSLTAAYQTGAISYEVYFENLQKGGIISSEKDIEDEKKALEESPVALPGGDGQGVRAPGEPATNAPPPEPAAGPGGGSAGSTGGQEGQ